MSISQSYINVTFVQFFLPLIHFDHCTLVTHILIQPRMLRTNYCHISITKSCFIESIFIKFVYLHPPIIGSDAHMLIYFQKYVFNSKAIALVNLM